MSEQQQQRTMIRDFDRFAMFTPTPGEEGKRSRLVWGLRGAYPRLSVFTNSATDTVKGPIAAPFSIESFLVFLDMFEKVALGEKGSKFKFDCFNSRYVDGKPADKYLQADVRFGKDENGIVWVMAFSEGRPKIKFDFKLSDFHAIHHGDGRQFTEAEASQLQALAVVRGLREIYIMKAAEFRDEMPNAKQGMSSSPVSKGASLNSEIAFDDISF